MAVSRASKRPYTESHDYIRIEGDSVKMVIESVGRVLKLEDFLNGIAQQGGIATPILPTGCKYFRKINNRSILVIEEPPKTRQLVWTGMNEDEKKISWRLAFPYVVFVLEFSDLNLTTNYRIFYRVAPLVALDDKLFHTNLCNVYLDDRICHGGIRIVGDTIIGKSEGFIKAFWQSTFNIDLDDHFLHDSTHNKSIISLEAWQASSKEDPFFMLGLKWRDACTLEQIIAKVASGG